MKTIYLLILLLGSYQTYSQMVTEFDGISKEKLYKKTKNWIMESYNSYDDVIRYEIENEKIEFTGISKTDFETKMAGRPINMDIRYTIEIAFKDGKYRFKPLLVEAKFIWNGNDNNQWYDVDDTNSTIYKKGILHKKYKDVPAVVERTLKRLNDNLAKYIAHDPEDDRW